MVVGQIHGGIGGLNLTVPPLYTVFGPFRLTSAVPGALAGKCTASYVPDPTSLNGGNVLLGVVGFAALTLVGRVSILVINLSPATGTRGDGVREPSTTSYKGLSSASGRPAAVQRKWTAATKPPP